ncbi:MAG: hypothetical protein KJ906_03525 [Nanoarchaeota archaeon]|nr:hypothetical protein [Nanoarchaeota archaeon]
MDKRIKLTLVLIITVILYIVFVHEPAHYIACELVGGDASFGFLELNPAVNCVFNGASNLSMFFVFIAPYIVDLFILLLFLKVKRNRWTYFLPTIAFMNTAGCGLIAPLIQVQIGNDFVNMALVGLLPTGLVLVVVNVAIWAAFYRTDLTDKKRLSKILK